MTAWKWVDVCFWKVDINVKIIKQDFKTFFFHFMASDKEFFSSCPCFFGKGAQSLKLQESPGARKCILSTASKDFLMCWADAIQYLPTPQKGKSIFTMLSPVLGVLGSLKWPGVRERIDLGTLKSGYPTRQISITKTSQGWLTLL